MGRGGGGLISRPFNRSSKKVTNPGQVDRRPPAILVETTANTPRSEDSEEQLSDFVEDWSSGYRNFSLVSEAEWLAIENLGHGSFANVLRMKKRDESGLELAIKFLRKESSPSSPKRGGRHDILMQNEMLRTMRHELKIISKLPAHPNIIKVLGASHDGSYFAMELAKSDLFQIARKQNVCMILRDAWNWLNQLTLAVLHLHSNNILHLDIKSSNVLIFNDNTVRLCDFGLSREIRDGTLTVDREVITLWYRAPEVLMGVATLNDRVDVWGIGCIALELLCGSTPFKGDVNARCPCKSPNHLNYNEDQLSKIFQILGTPRDMSFMSSTPCFPHFSGWPHFIPRLERMISTKMSGRGVKSQSFHPESVSGAVNDRRIWIQFLNASLAVNPVKRMSAQELVEIMPWSCSARRSLSSAQTPALFHEINAKNSQSAQELKALLGSPVLHPRDHPRSRVNSVEDFGAISFSSSSSSSSSSSRNPVVFFQAVTFSGYSLPSRSPSPSCPSHPHPHMYKEPSSDTNPLKLPAAATLTMLLLLNAVTSTGIICLDRDPVPNCPNFPSPHAITTLSLVTSTQCAPPAATSSTGIPARAGRGRGAKQAARWPSPRHPWAPSPHTKTSPPHETPTQKPAWRTARFTPRGVK
mmetsp:Transcript_18553/g.42343  ORF Transcript_18553/g.42343 Transcript_18553/m.42343 type:complete len:640 (-) Transcript_18553:815-2734(-)